MSGIRGKDTQPELQVRKGLHARGFRYRLHDRSLPGKPDLVLSRHRAIVFVHGCFWHGHACHLFRLPATREAFWREKIARNVERDCEAEVQLLARGWRVATVWECALKGKTRLAPGQVVDSLAGWLQGDARQLEVSGTHGD